MGEHDARVLAVRAIEGGRAGRRAFPVSSGRRSCPSPSPVLQATGGRPPLPTRCGREDTCHASGGRARRSRASCRRAQPNWHGDARQRGQRAENGQTMASGTPWPRGNRPTSAGNVTAGHTPCRRWRAVMPPPGARYSRRERCRQVPVTGWTDLPGRRGRPPPSYVTRSRRRALVAARGRTAPVNREEHAVFAPRGEEFRPSREDKLLPIR